MSPEDLILPDGEPMDNAQSFEGANTASLARSNTEASVLLSDKCDSKKSHIDYIEVLGSAAFVVVACLSIAAAISLLVFNRQHNEFLSPESDCSQIQVFGNIKRYEKLLLSNATTFAGLPEPIPIDPNNDPLQRTFILDVKTAAVFTFAWVRVIDVAWNLFAGQGIRLVVGFVTYLVNAHWLTSKSSQVRVAYPFYTTIGFEGATLVTVHQSSNELFRLCRKPRVGSRVRTKSSVLFLIWTTLSMIYTLSIPSLLNAASGYIIPSKPIWKMYDDSLVFDLYPAYRACWEIQDGYRISLPNNRTVISGPTSWEFELFETEMERQGVNNVTKFDTKFSDFDDIMHYYMQLFDINEAIKTEASKRFPDPSNASSYERYMIEKEKDEYIFLKYYNSTTKLRFRGQDYDLEAPPLELGNMQTTAEEYAVMKDDPTAYAYSSLPNGVKRRCYKDYVVPWGQETPMHCSNTSDNYSWAFSSTISSITLFIHAIWCLSTCIVWIWVRRASKRLGRERMGVYQTALVLVESMRRELGERIQEYTEKDLSWKLKDKAMDIPESEVASKVNEGWEPGVRRRG